MSSPAERQRKFRKANPIKAKAAKSRYMAKGGQYTSRALHLKERYGITLEEFELLIKQQNSLCAICQIPLAEPGKTGMAPVVDHDHETGLLRGILHRKCNSAIGALGDCIQGLQAAVNYLEKHRANSESPDAGERKEPSTGKDLDGRN